MFSVRNKTLLLGDLIARYGENAVLATKGLIRYIDEPLFIVCSHTLLSSAGQIIRKAITEEANNATNAEVCANCGGNSAFSEYRD